MNIDRLTEIAEWLEAGAPEKCNISGFNMNTFGEKSSCGTVCCIAGSANAFHFESIGEKWNVYDLDDPGLASTLLGLTEDQSYRLFYPESWAGNVGCRNPELKLDWKGEQPWHNISPQHAARVIRNLIATGDVDWNLPEVAA